MGRQPLWRRVNFIPQITYFKPAGVRLAELEEIWLAVEEAEAIRLKDLEGLEQEECAQRMKISRTTYSRVLASARKKVADALLNGKAVRIEGGNFEMASRRYRCFNGHEWDVPFETVGVTPPDVCPTCTTTEISPLPPIVFGRRGVGHGGYVGGRRCGWKYAGE